MRPLLPALLVLGVLALAPALVHDSHAQQPCGTSHDRDADYLTGPAGQACHVTNDYVVTEQNVEVSFRPLDNDRDRDGLTITGVGHGNREGLFDPSPGQIQLYRDIVGTLAHEAGSDTVTFTPAENSDFSGYSDVRQTQAEILIRDSEGNDSVSVPRMSVFRGSSPVPFAPIIDVAGTATVTYERNKTFKILPLDGQAVRITGVDVDSGELIPPSWSADAVFIRPLWNWEGTSEITVSTADNAGAQSSRAISVVINDAEIPADSDSDGDGHPDRGPGADRCPSVPAGGTDADDDGCPDAGTVPTITDDSIAVEPNTPRTGFDPTDNDAGNIELKRFRVMENGAGTLRWDDGGTPGDRSDDTVEFIPVRNFEGTDAFTVPLRDGTRTLTSTLTVTVGEGMASDSDNDGVDNSADLCPDSPPTASVNSFGCLDADSDGDGIVDELDRCPGAAAVNTAQNEAPGDTDLNNDGCNDDDFDGDGVRNDGDACPLAHALLDGAEDRNGDGCPDARGFVPYDEVVGDYDGDGVPNGEDGCPRVHAETADGCPGMVISDPSGRAPYFYVEGPGVITAGVPGDLFAGPRAEGVIAAGGDIMTSAVQDGPRRSPAAAGGELGGEDVGQRDDEYALSASTLARGVALDVFENDIGREDIDETTISDPPDHGMAVINEVQDHIWYQAGESFAGVDSFTYSVTSGGVTGTTDVTITSNTGRGYTIGPLEAADDAIIMTGNEIALAAEGLVLTVLRNDSGPAGASITAVTEPSHGTARSSGSQITYTINDTFDGSDSFTYTLSHGESSDTATVTITAGAGGHVMLPDFVSTPTGTPVELDPLANNIGAGHEVASASFIPERAGTLTEKTAHGGEDSITGPGPFVFTPSGDYAGPLNILFTVESGGSEVGTDRVTLTITDVDGDNDGIVDRLDACPDVSGFTTNGCPSTDTDGDGVPDATDECDGVPGPGTTTGCPADDRDGDGISNTANAGGNVPDRCPDDFPAADANNDGCTDAVIVEDAAVTVAGDATVQLDPLANDTGEGLVVHMAFLGKSGAGSMGGTFPGAGPFTFTPKLSFAGDVTATFIIRDGPTFARSTIDITVTDADADDDGLRNALDTLCPATDTSAGDYVDIDGNGCDDADNDGDGTPDSEVQPAAPRVGPTAGALDAVDDAITLAGNELEGIALTVLRNDSGPEDTAITSVTQPDHGTAAHGADSVGYEPDETFAGSDSFTYTITGGGSSDTATVTVTAGAGGHVMVPHFETTAGDTAIGLDPLENNIGSDQTVSATSFVPASAGTLTENADGAASPYTFTPSGDYAGPLNILFTVESGGSEVGTDRVTLVITDADGDSDGVSNLEDACPETSGTANGATDDSPMDGCPDNDVDGDGVLDAADECDGVPGPDTATGCPAGDRDGDGISNTADAEGNVPDRCPDDFPAADANNDGCTDAVIVEDAAVTVAGDATIQLDPLANDTGTDLTVHMVSMSKSGTGTMSGVPGAGPFTFTPKLSFAGDVTATFVIRDGPTFARSTVDITVTDGDADGDGVGNALDTTCPSTDTSAKGYIDIDGNGCDDSDNNGAGVGTVAAFSRSSPLGAVGELEAVDDEVTLPGGRDTITIHPAANDVGPTDTHITAVTQGAEGGTVELNDDETVTWTFADGFDGEETFTYTIAAGHGADAATDTATVTVTGDAGGHVINNESIGSVFTSATAELDPLANNRGEGQTVTSARVSPAGAGTLAEVTPHGGDKSITGPGPFTFVPSGGYFGRVNVYFEVGSGGDSVGTDRVRLFLIPGDSDGDGVDDDEDLCPGTPGGAAAGPRGCPAGDRDGDGVPDAQDACDDIPVPATANGCPDGIADRTTDSDGDGVPDGYDRCPTTAPTAADANRDGCNDAVIAPDADVDAGNHAAFELDPLSNDTGTALEVTAATLDRDDAGRVGPFPGTGPFTFVPAADYVGDVTVTFYIKDGPTLLTSTIDVTLTDADDDNDGVANGDDSCPGTDTAAFNYSGTDENGCPHDGDGDGIIDTEDKCPLLHGTRNGQAADTSPADGCPDDDHDGDGVLNTHDRCPGAPNSFDGSDDENADGCPDDLEGTQPEVDPVTPQVREFRIEDAPVDYEDGLVDAGGAAVTSPGTARDLFAGPRAEIVYESGPRTGDPLPEGVIVIDGDMLVRVTPEESVGEPAAPEPVHAHVEDVEYYEDGLETAAVTAAGGPDLFAGPRAEGVHEQGPRTGDPLPDGVIVVDGDMLVSVVPAGPGTAVGEPAAPEPVHAHVEDMEYYEDGLAEPDGAAAAAASELFAGPRAEAAYDAPERTLTGDDSDRPGADAQAYRGGGVRTQDGTFNADNPLARSASGDEHLEAPTFGTSLLTGERQVECGYAMDGVCRDVTEYHVEYEREIIETGSTHDFALRAHGTDDIEWFQIGFGVPGIGSATEEAEAVIHVEVSPDYDSEAGYAIERVEYRNGGNVIGEDAEFSVYQDRCTAGGDERDCVTLEISGVLFREQMYSEPFVISVMDENRRTATHYMNDGLLVRGDSLNPAPEHVMTERTASQQAAESVTLYRTDKLADLWADGAGHVFTRNDSGTWILLESPAADMSSACTDVEDRACDAFADKLASYTGSMERLRDELFGGVYSGEFEGLADAVTIHDLDGDSRTAFLEENGMSWLRS